MARGRIGAFLDVIAGENLVCPGMGGRVGMNTGTDEPRVMTVLITPTGVVYRAIELWRHGGEVVGDTSAAGCLHQQVCCS